MKKPGQPDNALEITAGRRCLLIALKGGVAQRAEMSMVANWLRDLYTHRRIPVKCLETYKVYQQLMNGSAVNHDVQQIVLTWINDLLSDNLTYAERENQMPEQPNEDELLAQGQRESLPANSMQVGGSHYNVRPIQHWDFVASHDYGYLEGQVTKYLFRWRDKNGVQDLEKASHFLQKLSEVSESDASPINLQVFLDANDIPEEERSIYVALHAYHGTLDPTFLEYARAALARVVAKAR